MTGVDEDTYSKVKALQIIVHICQVTLPDYLLGGNTFQGDLGCLLSLPLGEALQVALLTVQIVVVQVCQAPAE
jgi:hypothetical protein